LQRTSSGTNHYRLQAQRIFLFCCSSKLLASIPSQLGVNLRSYRSYDVFVFQRVSAATDKHTSPLLPKDLHKWPVRTYFVPGDTKSTANAANDKQDYDVFDP